jgi:molybdenum cofactor synthesis domain-containing protein
VTTAGIVIIGDEILSGKFADENAAFLITELRALGVDLRRIDVIQDDRDEIARTVRSSADRFDIVFTSGGVGPTHDDITMAAIAQGFDTEVMLHPELEAKVRGYYGAKLVAANLRLAEVPHGAQLAYGQDKIWPVVHMRNVYILPGVPALFKRKFLDISDRFRTTPVTVARLYIDRDEGDIAAAMTDAANAFPTVRIGSYPRFSETDFKVLITLESVDVTVVAQALAQLSHALAPWVVRTVAPGLAGK